MGLLRMLASCVALTWRVEAARAAVAVFPTSGPLFPDFDCLKAVPDTGRDLDIDWPAWLKIFDKVPSKKWGDYSSTFLNTYMDADAETLAHFVGECPLGVLNADLLLYAIAMMQGDQMSGAVYGARAHQTLVQFPLHVLAGSRWPLLVLLTSERLRSIRPGGRNIADDPIRNCQAIPKPALNWGGFLGVFSEGKLKDWYDNSIRYVFSWQMGKIPQSLEAECPLGVLTAHAIKAFTCATSESTCYADLARKLQTWLSSDPESFHVLAHGRWPLALVLNHMARATRHRFHLDFTEAELIGTPLQDTYSSVFNDASVPPFRRFGLWTSSLVQSGYSQSFRDLISALLHLGPASEGADTLVYITMIYGASFNKHMRRFCMRARALGAFGRRLLLFTLDEEAYRLCQVENEHRCIRGTPSIMNKFTLPLLCANLGLDSMWIDLDVFLMVDPTPVLMEHASRGPYDILISGSFEADCICNGLVYFRATDKVQRWLLAVMVWMYHHPYEHDQKTFSAFLNYTETVSREPLDLPSIPPWDTLDPITQFVTPDTYEGNGWSGDIEQIVIYHFLNGESDTGSDLDPSGTWMREHGRFDPDGTGPPPCRTKGKGCSSSRISLMDLFYEQNDEELYSTAKPAHSVPALRRALLSSRKDVRRTHLLGKPCGPMVGVLGQETIDEQLPEGVTSVDDLVRLARQM